MARAANIGHWLHCAPSDRHVRLINPKYTNSGHTVSQREHEFHICRLTYNNAYEYNFTMRCVRVLLPS